MTFKAPGLRKIILSSKYRSSLAVINYGHCYYTTETLTWRDDNIPHLVQNFRYDTPWQLVILPFNSERANYHRIYGTTQRCPRDGACVPQASIRSQSIKGEEVCPSAVGVSEYLGPAGPGGNYSGILGDSARTSKLVLATSRSTADEWWVLTTANSRLQAVNPTIETSMRSQYHLFAADYA